MAKDIFYIDIDGQKINNLINWRHNPLTTAQRNILGATLTLFDISVFVFDIDLFEGFYWSGSEWVSGTPGFPLVNNGLTETANVIQLGGPLIQDTTIDTSGGFKFQLISEVGSFFTADSPIDGTMHFVMSTGEDINTSQSTLDVFPTGIFGNITDPSGTTLIYIQPSRVEFDTPLFALVSVLQIFDGTQGNIGDVFTSIDTQGKGRWQTPPSAPVTSVFGRTGAVIAQNADYNTSQVTENTNLYFTNARAIGSLLTGYISGPGTISAADSVLIAIEKLNGNIGALVTGVSSFNTRTGAITLISGDVTTALTFTPVPTTRLINTTSPLFGGGDLSADRTLTIQNAAADGVTKGAATFNAPDFNDNGAGLILIDYTNGQKASGTTNGFLTSSDWNLFNNKAKVVDIQIFTVAGANVWTQPAGAKIVVVEIIAGGGGGGSGRRGAANSVRTGGGGGGGGGYGTITLPAAILGSTEIVTVGNGGNGGAAQTVNDQNGNPGIVGGNSSFGVWLYLMGGGPGALGQTGAVNGGTAGIGFPVSTSYAGGAGQGNGATGAQGVDTTVSVPKAGGGGGAGGGITSTNIAATGISGNLFGFINTTPGYNVVIPAGAHGGLGADGLPGTAVGNNSAYGGSGGGGGGASITGPAGAGANGNSYGCGGSGGGASLDGNNSGKGGNGSPGIVIVYTYF